jgi:hypothetical protein
VRRIAELHELRDPPSLVAELGELCALALFRAVVVAPRHVVVARDVRGDVEVVWVRRARVARRIVARRVVGLRDLARLVAVLVKHRALALSRAVAGCVEELLERLWSELRDAKEDGVAPRWPWRVCRVEAQ